MGEVPLENLSGTVWDRPASGQIQEMVFAGHAQLEYIPLRYRGTSLIRNSAPLGPYSRTMPRALRWS